MLYKYSKFTHFFLKGGGIFIFILVKFSFESVYSTHPHWI